MVEFEMAGGDAAREVGSPSEGGGERAASGDAVALVKRVRGSAVHHTSFSTAFCSECEADVLLHHARRAGGDGSEVWFLACVHCGGQIEGRSTAGADKLRSLGYRFEGDEIVEEPDGCGKPNCSKGQCKHSSKRHPFKEDGN